MERVVDPLQEHMAPVEEANMCSEAGPALLAGGMDSNWVVDRGSEPESEGRTHMDRTRNYREKLSNHRPRQQRHHVVDQNLRGTGVAENSRSAPAKSWLDRMGGYSSQKEQR